MKYDPEKHRRRSIRLKGYDYAQAGAYFVTICTQNRECLFGDVVDGAMRLNEFGEIVRLTWEDLPNHVANIVLDAFVVMPNHAHGIIFITDSVGDVGAGSEPAPTEPAPTAAPVPTAPAPTAPAPTAPVPTGPVPTAPAPTAPVPTAPAPTEPAPTAPVPTAPVPTEPAPTEPAPTEPVPTEPAPTQHTQPRRYPLPEIIRQFKTFSARRINELRGTPGISVWQRNYYEHIIRNEESLNRIRRYILENPQRWAMDRENPNAVDPEPEEAWQA